MGLPIVMCWIDSSTQSQAPKVVRKIEDDWLINPEDKFAREL